MDNLQATPRTVVSNETAHVVEFRNLLGEVRTELIGLHLFSQPSKIWAELGRIGAELDAHAHEACCRPFVGVGLQHPARSGVMQHRRSYLALETCQLDCALERRLDRFHGLIVCPPESNVGECGNGLEEGGGHGW
ncbi:MAG: hypothetical protein RO009_04205 [Pseudorhodoplanes sp.]|jgi:hypothetical protein|nr:hypothetical protein [Pseudorhodoplanes sp.]